MVHMYYNIGDVLMRVGMYRILVITVTNVLQIGVLCDDIHVNLDINNENFFTGT